MEAGAVVYPPVVTIIHGLNRICVYSSRHAKENEIRRLSAAMGNLLAG
jgi:hypothetical protein